MIAYLLNLTAIWLLSLIIFDLVLKKETFHGYNRFYLLFTLIVGAAFPLIEWGDGGPLPARIEPVERLVAAKESVAADTTVRAGTFAADEWFLNIYLAGAAVSLLLVTIDIIRLARLFGRGIKHREGAIQVVETGQNHAPFSLFNKLFVSGRKNYSDEQWHLITSHELRHGMLLHFADLLLVQLLQIIFWFHPLIYVYRRRLLLVHEFQADDVAGNDAAMYGRFLIEQALLRGAPSITHSLNRSPIKNRILMLTKTSSRTAGIKSLVLLPLMATCIVCFANNRNQEQPVRKGDVITYKGNTIELHKADVADTITVENPLTGEIQNKVVTRAQLPARLNGQKIYTVGDGIQWPEFKGGEASVLEQLYERLKPLLTRLPDDKYRIEGNMVVDARGRVVYQEVWLGSNWKIRSGIPQDLLQQVNSELGVLVESVTLKPAQYDGKPQPFMLYLNKAGKSAVVKGGNMSIE